MTLTAEEFSEHRLELAEAGRWVELLAGEIVEHSPPESLHGSIVLNLSKQFALFRQANPDHWGAVCFDLGFLMSRSPDSVLVPAVSIIPDVGPFELSTEFLTIKRPTLVIEILSSENRRRFIETKRKLYLKYGVSFIWIIDTAGKDVTVIDQEEQLTRLSSPDELITTDICPGFSISVGELFQEPEWWSR